MPTPIRCAVVLAAVWVTACSNFDRDRYLPTSPDTLNALELDIANASIPADGFSTTLVTVTISPNAASNRRTIQFTTTSGTFVGGAGDAKSIESVVADDGITAVQLRSSRNVEGATVTASVKDVPGLSKQRVVHFVAVSASNLIRLSTNVLTAPADGASITVVTAEIAGGLPSDRRQVTFATSLGTFVADPQAPASADLNRKTIEIDADGGNRAVAFLRSRNDEVGQAIVTARVDTPSVSANASLEFTRALPDDILVTTNLPSVPPSFTSAIVVTVTLLRDQGIATKGTVVKFRATDALGADRSFFTNVTRSDDDGVATATFSPGTGAANGPLVIAATVDGTSAVGSVSVEVVP